MRWRGEGSLTGSKRLILPDTCPDRDSGWSFRRSGRYSRRSVKPSADPTLVRTRHLLLLLARGKSPRSRPPRPQQRRGSKPCRRCSAGTSLPISGCLARTRRGNAAFRSPTSADAPEQPVLDVRNQPDNHRPRRNRTAATCATPDKDELHSVRRSYARRDISVCASVDCL